MGIPSFIDILLGLVLAFIMMSVGLSLSFKNFKDLFYFSEAIGYRTDFSDNCTSADCLSDNIFFPICRLLLRWD